MKPWTKLLPFLVVEWLSKKYDERWWDKNAKKSFTYPYKDVRFYLDSEDSK